VRHPDVDPGIANVTIQLFEQTSPGVYTKKPVETTTTNADGFYEFNDLDQFGGSHIWKVVEIPPGTPYVHEGADVGFVQHNAPSGPIDLNVGTLGSENPPSSIQDVPLTGGDYGGDYNFCEVLPPVHEAIRMTGGGSVFLPAATATNGVVGGPAGTRVTH